MKFLMPTMGLLLILQQLACGGNYNINIKGRDKTIVVPNTASMQPPYESNGQSPPRRYVVRMSDGKLDWEIELPESANGYELRIPFQNKSPNQSMYDGDQMTAADKALVGHLRQNHPSYQNEQEGIHVDPANPQQNPQNPELPQQNPQNPQNPEPQQNPQQNPAPSRQSYLVGLEKAKQLFTAGKYELSLVALSSLNEDYPNDIKILSMIGTLWMKMNKPELARGYWEQVLRMDPENRSIIEALKQINSRSDGTETQE
jgi:hypothetical protein